MRRIESFGLGYQFANVSMELTLRFGDTLLLQLVDVSID